MPEKVKIAVKMLMVLMWISKVVLGLGLQENTCPAYRSPQFQLPACENKQLIIPEDSERKEERGKHLQFFRVPTSSLAYSWWKCGWFSTYWGGIRWKQKQATDRKVVPWYKVGETFAKLCLEGRICDL